MRRRIKRTPEIEKQVVALHDEGMATKNIAEELEISCSLAKTILADLRPKVIDKMQRNQADKGMIIALHQAHVEGRAYWPITKISALCRCDEEVVIKIVGAYEKRVHAHI